MKKFSLLVASVAMLALSACGNAATNTQGAEAAEAPADVVNGQATALPDVPAVGVIALDDDALFRPDTKVPYPVVLDFNATWCVPCKKLTPAFDKASEAYAGKVAFYSVDIDINKETAKAFSIQGVPTVIFLTPAGKVEVYVGLDPFVGDNFNPQTPADETTQLIYDNMCKLIDETL